MGRAFKRGDVVTDAELGGRADSYRRLGLVTIIKDTSGTKKELAERATLLGIEVPASATKPQIIKLIEGAA
ncbi:MAG: hypothetical protein QGD91_12465 [Actinomycetota bacterium]|nr:hypothetical protein [Actinomycetota bacterium]